MISKIFIPLFCGVCFLTFTNQAFSADNRNPRQKVNDVVDKATDKFDDTKKKSKDKYKKTKDKLDNYLKSDK